MNARYPAGGTEWCGVRRPGVEELPPDECQQLLASTYVGRLAFVVDGWPIVLPVNYDLAGDDVIVRTDPGAKLDAAHHEAPVSFEIDDFDPFYQTGWSVLVKGRLTEVGDETGVADRLRLRPWAGGPKSHILRLRPAAVTGRRIVRAERSVRWRDRAAE
jgi:uncharacterized protein